jgi:chloramphenicol-sensitive protein RarD
MMLTGVFSAGLAFLIWGTFPIYLRTLQGIPPLEILANRVCWSVVFLGLLLLLRRQWGWLTQIRNNPKLLLSFVDSALMLTLNWVIYIWSVNAGQIIDATLGYFITPLVNVLFGLMLGERLRIGQWTSVILAASGVAWLTFSAGQLPWVGLMLAASFGMYGLLRKTAALGALEGLSIETLIILPAALGFLLIPGSGSSHSVGGDSLSTSLLLMAAGPVTAIPLLLFAHGARRIPLSVLGILQYIGPTIQFLLGVWLYHEPFEGNKMIGFSIIWSALALYSAEGLWRAWLVRDR